MPPTLIKITVSFPLFIQPFIYSKMGIREYLLYPLGYKPIIWFIMLLKLSNFASGCSFRLASRGQSEYHQWDKPVSHDFYETYYGHFTSVIFPPYICFFFSFLGSCSLALQDAMGSSFISFTLAIDAIISPSSPGSFHWTKETKIWACILLFSKVTLLYGVKRNFFLIFLLFFHLTIFFQSMLI